ncbi:MAG: diaminopimelate epimerase [Pseudobdellovibrio sp.]
MTIKTELISGAGNTFHIAFQQEKLFTSKAAMRSAAQKICKENPADGFIFLESASDSSENYRWTFFNNDGSEAEMCGNATRCVGYFLKLVIGSDANSWTLHTVAGPIQIQSLGSNQFKIVMSAIRSQPSSLGFFCDTGVPHLVMESDDSQLLKHLNSELKNKAVPLRTHAEFAPKGTNVTFVYLEGDTHKLKAVSYERGVEDFTQACGTGAMAAAYYNLTKRGMTETEVEMPGGVLKMNLVDLSRPIMIGPAELLGSFKHEISI